MQDDQPSKVTSYAESMFDTVSAGLIADELPKDLIEVFLEKIKVIKDRVILPTGSGLGMEQQTLS